MPELPEVETLCRQLQPIILGEKIHGFEIVDSRLGIIGGIVGRNVTSVVRQGKALEIELDKSVKLVLHLRMTGRFQWQSSHQALPSHTRFIMAFPHGSLLCIDPRRFATLSLRDTIRCNNTVIDPSRNYPLSSLWKNAGVKRLPVKSFLIDQRIIAGIGNIYACEILHGALIKPWRQTCSVTKQEWKRIATVMRDILNRAIACRGTSVSDWRDLHGNKGEYQHELKVYRREGCPCPRCHGEIQRVRLSGRGTYFCPDCQV
jgi:formamidopyrimidine-DNA glycosylase